jgi:hypothetical protein
MLPNQTTVTCCGLPASPMGTGARVVAAKRTGRCSRSSTPRRRSNPRRSAVGRAPSRWLQAPGGPPPGYHYAISSPTPLS